MILWGTSLFKAISLWVSFGIVIQGDISNRTGAELKNPCSLNKFLWLTQTWDDGNLKELKDQSIPLLFSPSTFRCCQNPKMTTFCQNSMSYIQRSAASHFLNPFLHLWNLFLAALVCQLSSALQEHLETLSQHLPKDRAKRQHLDSEGP